VPFARKTLRGATRGYVIGFMSCSGGDVLGGDFVPLEYLSREQRHVVRSTFAAELFSLVDMLDHMLLIAFLLSEIKSGVQDSAVNLMKIREGDVQTAMPMDAVLDANSVWSAIALDPIKIPSERSLLGHLCWVKELIDAGTLSTLIWCDTRDILADGLNKGVVSRWALRGPFVNCRWRLAHPVKVLHRKTTPDGRA